VADLDSQTNDPSVPQELLDILRLATDADAAAFQLADAIEPDSPAASRMPFVVQSPRGHDLDFGIHEVDEPTVHLVNGSAVTASPVVGSAAEAGWVGVLHKHPDDIDPRTAELVTKIARLLEECLDRAAEQVRLDELSDLLRSNQEHLHVTRDELSMSNQELEQFAYIAAHELVAPLRAVAVYAEVLESVTVISDADSASGAQDCVNQIRAGVQQMTKQVQSLLNLSTNQLDAAAVTPIDVGHVVQAALDTVALSLDEVDAIVHIAEPLPTVVATSIPLQSVFANLFSNAVRYRAPDRQLEIRVSSTVDDQGVRIEVSDNGSGVSEIDHARIFQMFERASTVGAGSGIGLALSRKILAQFGATIGVDAGESAGSVFWLRFPTAPAS